MENEHECDCGCCSDTEMTKVEMTICELNDIIGEVNYLKEYLNELIIKAERVNLREECARFKEDIERADEIIRHAEEILNTEATISEVKEKNETIPEELNGLQKRLCEIKDDLNKIE
ncbi:MAG: hypothetical protein ACP5N0_04895 [Methanosarcina sp.]